MIVVQTFKSADLGFSTRKLLVIPRPAEYNSAIQQNTILRYLSHDESLQP
jgi:hypothetical protein